MIFVLSGPSCVGKTTLSNILSKEVPNLFESISYTTRNIRNNEINEIDYYFINKEEFLAKIDKQEFIEYAKVHNNYYGTSKNVIENMIDQNKNIILVLDIEGAMNIKKFFKTVSIFIMPKSLDIIKDRLIKRGNSDIDIRIKNAEKEIKKNILFDHIVINDDFNECIEQLKYIILINTKKR